MGLVITGSHRSGTSAIARVVHGIGLSAASDERRLMAAAPDNPRGFFERVDVADLNDAWLSDLGGSWWAPPATSETTWTGLDRERLNRERASLELFDPDSPAWFVKDPRISLLLPVWDRLALRELPVVLAIRDPRDVVTSLRLRDGMTPTRALALWYTYTARLLEQASDRPVLIIDYDQLVHSPVHAAAAISQFVQATTRSGPSRLAPEQLGELVDARLQRNRGSGVRGVHTSDLEAALELYRDLAKRHAQDLDRAPAPPSPPAWVDAVLAEAREANTLRHRLEVVDGELRAALDEVAGLRERPSTEPDAASQLQATRIDELLRELAGRELDLAEAQGLLSAEREEAARLRRQAAEDVEEAARLQAHAEDVQRQLETVSASSAAAQEQLDRALVEARRERWLREQLEGSIAEVRDELRRSRLSHERVESGLRDQLDRSRALADGLAGARTSMGADLRELQGRLARSREAMRALTEDLEAARSAAVRAADERRAAQVALGSSLAERQVLADDLRRVRSGRAYRLGRSLTAPVKALTRRREAPELSAEDIALILRSGFFDPDWYARHSPDVVAAGIDPVDHYLHQGWRELRSPGPRFDAAWYTANHEVPEGVNPLVHYLRSAR